MRWPPIGWPWPRRRPAPDGPAVLEFDACIDVPGPAAAAVRARVEAEPGAHWISVEGSERPGVAIKVYPRGLSVEPDGFGWEALRTRIGAVVTAAIAEAAEWDAGSPVRAGFAEPVSGFDDAALSPALRQLAALAGAARPLPPPPPPALPKLRVETTPAAAGSDDERLAALLGMVLPADASAEAPAVAQAAVRRFGSYAAVLAAPEAELRRVAGLGTHSVAAIKLVHAAAIRLARAGIIGRPVLESRAQLADYLAAALARERIEQFRILFLDAAGMLRADEIQARGTVNHTPVYPREVVRRALSLGAASLILVHNHPSGDPTPSREDIEMTRQVRDAAAVMNIGLRDHVIVGNGRWLSFRDEGLLDSQRH